jgi:hypothetical protein
MAGVLDVGVRLSLGLFGWYSPPFTCTTVKVAPAAWGHSGHEPGQIHPGSGIHPRSPQPELVLVSRGGHICGRAVQPAQVDGVTVTARPPRHATRPPAPVLLRRSACVVSAASPAWRRSTSSARHLNVCVQHRGERVADRADYRVVRLGVPVKLV